MKFNVIRLSITVVVILFLTALLTIAYFAAWLRALDQRSTRLQRHDYSRPRQEPEKWHIIGGAFGGLG